MIHPIEPNRPVAPAGDDGPVRLRLDIAYDGADFSGWARQPNLRTVQGEVERALTTVLRLPEQAFVQCAGRTDAGVHARGQVAHVDLPSANPLDVAATDTGKPPHQGDLRVVVGRLNRYLPDDVVIKSMALAPRAFDARFSALSRHYSYRIADATTGLDPLARRVVLAHDGVLDIDLMNAAARKLLGEHDFAAFCRRRAGATTVRTLLALAWERDRTGAVVLRISADAFCHSMVRSLVGAMLAVGSHRRSVSWIDALLESDQRESSVAVVAPHALVLERVEYPPNHLLLARATATRAMRCPPGEATS